MSPGTRGEVLQEGEKMEGGNQDKGRGGVHKHDICIYLSILMMCALVNSY